jgi:hypothetical protein
MKTLLSLSLAVLIAISTPMYGDAATTAPKSTTSQPPETSKPAESSKPSEPPKTETPAASAHQYDPNDPNVKKYPVYTTAKTAKELQAGSLGWRSAAEIIAEQKRDHEDYLIDGKTFYEWRMAPIIKSWDEWVAANGKSYKGKTDYENAELIYLFFESGKDEEFIGLWRPGFKYALDANGNIDKSKNCVPRAEAVEFLMIAMGFEMFQTISCDTGSPLPHSINAYWDSAEAAPRFLDAGGAGVRSVYLDDLDELGYKLY